MIIKYRKLVLYIYLIKKYLHIFIILIIFNKASYVFISYAHNFFDWLTKIFQKYVGVNMTIEFEIYVNKNSSPALNNMSDKIEDILILHLQGGKLFIYIFIIV